MLNYGIAVKTHFGKLIVKYKREEYLTEFQSVGRNEEVLFDLKNSTKYKG